MAYPDRTIKWIFGGLMAVVFCTFLLPLAFRKRQKQGKGEPGTFPPEESTASQVFSLKWRYITVYVLAFFCDWLQGPFMYVLYESYQFSEFQIGLLFGTGFLTSGLLGMAIGPAVDIWGRKRSCLVYCGCYILASFLHNFNNGILLTLSHVVGGIATSLLFSAFDCWLMGEFRNHNYPLSELGSIFSYAATGSAASAICAGIVASFSSQYMGPVGPFNVAIGVLLLLAVLICLVWDENYGTTTAVLELGEDAVESQGIASLLKETLSVIYRTPSILFCGGVEIFFEVGMYTCVIIWSPLLPADMDRGLVFSCFMACMMVGSRAALLSSFIKHLKWEAYSCCLYTGLAAASIYIAGGGVGEKKQFVVLAGLCAWELSVGCYFAHFFSVRGKILPSHGRATILNIMRMPLYLGMLAICMLWSYARLATVCSLCAVIFLFAAGCAMMMSLYIPKKESTPLISVSISPRSNLMYSRLSNHSARMSG